MATSASFGQKARLAVHLGKDVVAAVGKAVAVPHARAAQARVAGAASTGAADGPSRLALASARQPAAGGPQAAVSAPAGLSRRGGAVARGAIAARNRVSGL